MKREVADSLGLLLLVVGVSLILVPLVNVGLTVYPWRPGVRDWRFGAWGFLLGALTLPVLGFGLVGASGVLRESSAVIRVAMAGAALFVLVVAVGIFDFVIAGTAMRRLAKSPQIAGMFSREIRKTVFISAVALPAFAAMGIAAYRLLKGIGHPADERPPSILRVGKN